MKSSVARRKWHRHRRIENNESVIKHERN
jgi:hypothetical protein